MKSSGFLPFMVLLALRILASWTVEGGKNVVNKIGACPSRKPVKCLRPEKPQCNTDWECPGKKRCCQDRCSTKCIDPVPIRRPVMKKHGKCLQTVGRCWFCKNDGQCDEDYKCCPSMCRKMCLCPLNG